MSDPAIEAAQRAWEANQLSCWPSFNAEEGAREALKPIRELHKPVKKSGRNGIGCDHCWDCHDDNNETWPCDTAKLIYTSEELA